MKLRGIEVSETVCSLLDRARFAEVAREAFSVVRLILARIGHVGRDVNQPGDRRIRPGFRDYSAPIAMADQNALSILLSQGALSGSHIFFKGCLRLLDDADVVTILCQNVVNAFPTRSICPRAVDQNDVTNAMLFVLRWEPTGGHQ